MESGAIVSIISIIVSVTLGTASLVYACKTNQEKKKLEDYIQAELRGLAGNIDKIRVSPEWAEHHFGEIRNQALELEPTNEMKEIVRHAQDGAKDAAAASRMIRNLLNQVLTFQEGMFGTRELVHSDQDGNTQE